MAWPIGPLPPAAGSEYTLYQWVKQFPEAIRERNALISGLDSNFSWPRDTRVWGTAKVDHIDDNGDGTLSVYCKIWDGAAWVDPDWVGGRAGTGGTVKWWYNFPAGSTSPSQPYLPAYYKVAIYPPHSCEDRTGGDPAKGHCYHVDDNDETSVTIPNDGLLVLNGETLGDYADYTVDFLRASASAPEQYGYSWLMRYPPRPNDKTWAWDFAGKTTTLAVTGATFTVTIGGNVSPTIDGAANAGEIEAALEEITGITAGTVHVQNKSGGGFYIILSPDYGDVSVTASGATITQPHTVVGALAQTFNATDLVGKDIILEVDGRFDRETITAVDGHVLTFADPGGLPTVGNYFAAIEVGGYYRPRFYSGSGSSGFPTFRVETTERITRSGRTKIWESNRFWSLLTWYATLVVTFPLSHHPISDTLVGYALPKLEQEIKECIDALCDCDADAPLGGKETVTAFDVDLTTLPENFCTDFADLMYAPYFHYGLRGWQVDIDNLVGAFIEAKDWTGIKGVHSFTYAEWWAKHRSGNTRSPTISGVSSGVATFSAVTMPNRTTLEGAYTSIRCAYTMLNADGAVGASGIGTLTATSFTADNYTFVTTPATDVGKKLVVAFGEDGSWTRRFERQVERIYEMTVFRPGVDDDDAIVFPPDDTTIGSYQTDAPSTAYAEYDQYGKMSDGPTSLITGESARVVARHFETVSDYADDFEGLLFQGVPGPPPASTFPRFDRKSGGATAGGDFWLEDAGNLFWLSTNPLATHSGTGNGTSDASHLQDTTKSADLYWLDPNRFVEYILEVAISGAGTTGDPYIWERRPITVQSGTTLTVSPAFSATTSGRPYQIREAGYIASGAIKNRFKGRPLKISHTDGSVDWVIITHNDDRRLYWDQGAGVTAAEGDGYAIDEIQAGSVVHRKPSVTITHNGWVRAEDADADTRGHEWLTGTIGGLLNLPTIVNNYGRLRKNDIITLQVFLEMYTGLNAQRHRMGDASWTDQLGYFPDDPLALEDDDFYANSTFAADCAALIADCGGRWTPGSSHATGAFPPSYDTRIRADRSGNYGDGQLGGDLTVLTGTPVSAKAQSNSMSNCFESEVDIYARALAPTADKTGHVAVSPATPACEGANQANAYVFNAYGSGLLYDQFSKIATIAASVDPVRTTSARFGPSPLAATPAWPDNPLNPNTNNLCSPTADLSVLVMNGFDVVDEISIHKYDATAGGLIYVD